MPSHCSCYLKCHPVSLHKPYFKWHDSIFKFTTKKNGLFCMLFYYRCKYVLDFYIVLFLSMLSQKQLCLIKFLIFCTNAHLYSCFLLKQSRGTQQVQARDNNLLSNMSRLLFSWNRGQVDVTLHWWQRFNLASCPASLPLPQAARRANTEPAVATGFADDSFVVIDVGHASHCHHAGLKYLYEWVNMATI